MSQSPAVDLSTSRAFLWQGSTEPPSDVELWQPVRVVLAYITAEVYGLTVCPVLECGLAVHPVLPSIEMLIPGSISDLKFDEEVKRVSVTHFDQSTKSSARFHLSFDDKGEFWDFASTVAHLRSESENRKADLAYKLSLIRLFVPSHGPDGLMDVICTNADHAPGDDSSPLSSPSSSSSSAATIV